MKSLNDSDMEDVKPQSKEQLAAEYKEAQQWYAAKKLVWIAATFADHDGMEDGQYPNEFPGEMAALSAIMAIERKGDEILAKLDSIEKRLNETATTGNAGS